MHTLNLGLVGNCSISALIDPLGEVVWSCFPRFDGDPIFCSLLSHDGDAVASRQQGFYRIELVDCVRSEQHYLENTAVLVTRLFDTHGGAIEITDFCPRFLQFGRLFRPMMLVRMVKPLAGFPRIRIRIRPVWDYGATDSERTYGSHHIRYIGPNLVVRLTTNAPITAVAEELPFFLNDRIVLLLGPDESLQDDLRETANRFYHNTVEYWRDWVRHLAIPFEWQEAVIRAAIALKLNEFEDTGAIIAAMTTSIPEAPNTVRNWDYRYCWLRDAYFVLNTLNRLGQTTTLEHYLGYLLSVTANAHHHELQPVYGIDGRADLTERTFDTLSGYRGMGPVRVGNQAFVQRQNDVYGAAILAVAHAFFDKRLRRRGDIALFEQLEPLGERAVALYDQPDAGLWELRNHQRVHTFSAIMCWAACNRLAHIAARLGRTERAAYWHHHADTIKNVILKRGWSEPKQTFTAAFEGETLDASLLLIAELGFLPADDPRFVATVAAIERELRRGDFIFRYTEADDFGTPQTAFLVCTFWYINALTAMGRKEEARAHFERILALRNPLGLLSEDADPETGELWGNFVQTYSMAGIVQCAIRLSKHWDQAICESCP